MDDIKQVLKPLKVFLAQPRGFCAGVERAIEIVERALKIYGPPVYVRHEIVHNKRVVNNLSSKGAIFVQELDQIPAGAVTIFSAHGVAQKIEDTAKKRELPILDATCPLVAKVHKEGQRYSSKGYEVILIGHEGHPEVEGTMGRISGDVYLVSNTEDVHKLKVKNPLKLSYISQTTLSVDDTRVVIEALKKRFPSIEGPDVKDICYATQNRQSAVRDLVDHVNLILVVGAKNSSNSNRLRDLGEESGVDTYLIETADDLAALFDKTLNTRLEENVTGYVQNFSGAKKMFLEIEDAFDDELMNHDAASAGVYIGLPRRFNLSLTIEY